MNIWDTEKDSEYGAIERWDIPALLYAMNKEEARSVEAVHASIPQIAAFVEALVPRMAGGGRLIYVGAGTSGRLGVLDAAECIPTFGAPPGKVIGIIAGGEAALRAPVEAAEDDEAAAQTELAALSLTAQDTVVGISASGRTPYVLGAVRYAKSIQALTAAITCNPETPLEHSVDFPIVLRTGPEIVAGSTRLKAGTATKMVLNMISTATFTRLGHVKGGRMIDLQLVSRKLHQRALRYLQEATGLSTEEAEALLQRTQSLRRALEEASR
ncbi:MAG: N-acetylmuramic acid 6-phosphate etherase [Bacteroidia bacterium]|nr:N-acetylmuramic acid 6-phosphate etherase [Bacteroidia bacterium]MDW8235448.1 N-acetylmuramic acid 6-phosphate etherase [Bacteroidia bacterium]